MAESAPSLHLREKRVTAMKVDWRFGEVPEALLAD